MYYQNNLSTEDVQANTFMAFNANENRYLAGHCFQTTMPQPFINNVENSSSLLPATPSSNVHSKGSNSIVNNWITRNNNSKIEQERLPFSYLNVSTVRKDFIKCSALIREFERLLNLLQVFKKTLSDQEWMDRSKEVKCKEEEIINLMNKYADPEYLVAVQRCVKKSLKKRIYRKRKKNEWQELKRMRETFMEREHRRIDLWLEKMKDQVEKAQREEQVKREADLVLSDVTAKKAEAKRFINLLNTLAKLRNARAQQSTASGQFVSESEKKSFTQVVEKLKKLWLDQLKEYNMEEQGLRVMLDSAAIERVNVETKVSRQIQKKWYEFLFSGNSSKQSFGPNSLEELIANRCEWDRFVTSENSCLSSKIPLGFVIPSEPSSSEWSNFLKK